MGIKKKINIVKHISDDQRSYHISSSKIKEILSQTNTEIIDLSEIQNINETSYGLYPTVGENLDFINTNNLKIEFLYRKLDQFSWQYCNKGFFNFKNYIPKIITTFN